MRSLGQRGLLAALLLAMTPAVLAHGDVHERIDKLSKKFAQEPSDEILVRRARLYLEQGHASEARRDLLQALEFAPARYECWYYLSKAERLLGKVPAALEAADKFYGAADSPAARARGLVLRAEALTDAQQPLAAGEAYVAAIALEPEPNPEHFLLAANAFHKAGSPRALEVLDRGIRQLGPLVTLEDRALALEIETAQHEAALSRVEILLATNQRRAHLLHQKALVLRAMNRGAEAQQVLQAALAELDTLPEQRRRTRAMQALREQIERDRAG